MISKKLYQTFLCYKNLLKPPVLSLLFVRILYLHYLLDVILIVLPLKAEIASLQASVYFPYTNSFSIKLFTYV